MDAFSGYNQIQMAEVDQEKATFITDRGLYCYKVMPKEYLMNPSLLSRPMEGEVLYMYLAVSSAAISSALIREDKGI